MGRVYEHQLKVKPQKPFSCRSVELVTNIHVTETGHTDLLLFGKNAKWSMAQAALCKECGWSCSKDGVPWTFGDTKA